MIATNHGDPASFQFLQHPLVVSHWRGSRHRWWPYPRCLCCVQTLLYQLPFHFCNFNSSSKREIWERRCSPKSPFGPIRIRDGNVCLEFPFLTSLFDDLARVFLVSTLSLGAERRISWLR